MFEFEKLSGEEEGLAARRLNLARFIWTCNQSRHQFLPDFSWGELPWDIMLFAYIVEASDQYEDHTVHTMDSRLNSDVAQRYLDILSDRGLIERNASAIGPKSWHYRLSPSGLRAMEDWLDQCVEEAT